ncbi:hypothetical protein [Arenibaculum pallidiluteum]|uniref:hypothetical protein n=1 Tax=Arenibaculum pallidiluteum TaxID=2812559 RepID=UPI001A96848B|nr:hypothetical protein [Arenibaculum pallidiluteum]
MSDTPEGEKPRDDVTRGSPNKPGTESPHDKAEDDRARNEIGQMGEKSPQTDPGGQTA